jgi:hypothetical protein
MIQCYHGWISSKPCEAKDGHIKTIFKDGTLEKEGHNGIHICYNIRGHKTKHKCDCKAKSPNKKG